MRLVIALGLLFNCTLFSQGIAKLHPGQHIRIAVVGHGTLCDSALQAVSAENVMLRITSRTLECGPKGSVVNVSKDQIYQLTATRRLTKGRFALKVLAGMAGVAALCAIPLTSSDPESWLIVGNGVLPAFAAFGASEIVPKARDYVLLITCPDPFHCFSSPGAIPKGSPAPPNEK